MLIFPGSQGQSVSRSLVEIGVGEAGKVEVSKFPNGEMRIEVTSSVKGVDCMVVQSMAPEPNTSLVEFLLMVDALHENGAKKVIGLVPFMGYSLLTRHFDGHPVSSRVVARAISSSQVDEVWLCDVHEESVLSYFDVKVRNIETTDIFCKFAKRGGQEISAVVSPDKGAFGRARKLSECLGSTAASFSKERGEGGEIVSLDSKEPLQIDGNVILIDDLVNTGETVSIAASKLRELGASRVSLYVTHFLSVGESFNKINSFVNEIVVTNSVDHGLGSEEGVTVLDVEV